MAAEIEQFVASVLLEGRSVGDLVTADHTFINERLARHYGITTVLGPQFRRVTLPTRAATVCSARAPCCCGPAAWRSNVAGHPRRLGDGS